MPPFLTWCPDCGVELRDVGYKTCSYCHDEFCNRCFKDHTRWCKEEVEENE